MLEVQEVPPVPIHFLPHEILSCILLLVHDPDAYDAIECPFGFKDYYSWLYYTTTVVCRAWYHTIVTTPSFWTKLDINCSQEMTNCIISRSATEALHVSARQTAAREMARAREDWFVTTVLQHISRWKTANIRLDFVDASVFSNATAPQLAVFHLRQGAIREQPGSAEIILSAQTMPVLRDLYLCRLGFSWEIHLLSNLSSLRLSVPPEASLSFASLVVVLRQCGKLEDLALEEIHFIDDAESLYAEDVRMTEEDEEMDEASSDIEPVHLPALQCLKVFHLSPSDLFYLFLEIIECENLASCKIGLWEGSETIYDEEVSASLVPYFLALISDDHAEFGRVHHLGFLANEMMWVQITAYREHTDTSLVIYNHPWADTIHWADTIDQRFAPQVTRATFANHVEYSDILLDFHNISRVEFRRVYLESFIPFLRTKCIDEEQRVIYWLWPKLNQVLMRGCSFMRVSDQILGLIQTRTTPMSTASIPEGWTHHPPQSILYVGVGESEPANSQIVEQFRNVLEPLGGRFGWRIEDVPVLRYDDASP